MCAIAICSHSFFCFPFPVTSCHRFVCLCCHCHHAATYVFFCFHLYSCDPFNFCFSSFCVYECCDCCYCTPTSTQMDAKNKQSTGLDGCVVFLQYWDAGMKIKSKKDSRNRMLLLIVQMVSRVGVMMMYSNVLSKCNKMCSQIENETDLRTSLNSSFVHSMLRQNLMTNRKSILSTEQQKRWWKSRSKIDIKNIYNNVWNSALLWR